MITAENVHAHELVGLRVAVRESCNSQIAGASGTVLRESKNMLYLQQGGRLRAYPKAGSVWEFYLGGSKCAVDGVAIAKRPHERTRT